MPNWQSISVLPYYNRHHKDYSSFLGNPLFTRGREAGWVPADLHLFFPSPPFSCPSVACHLLLPGSLPHLQWVISSSPCPSPELQRLLSGNRLPRPAREASRLERPTEQLQTFTLSLLQIPHALHFHPQLWNGLPAMAFLHILLPFPVG